MEAKGIKWCPQHGYPLPCYKCGMPLSQPQQKEIYGAGKQAGIREVVGLVKDWETLHSNDFDAKYGIHVDSFGFQKGLAEIIKLHFGIDKPN